MAGCLTYSIASMLTKTISSGDSATLRLPSPLQLDSAGGPHATVHRGPARRIIVVLRPLCGTAPRCAALPSYITCHTSSDAVKRCALHMA
jgi:hypothetical protein